MAARKSPSEKQRTILESIWRCIRDGKRPPSVRELQVEIGVKTPSAVDYHVRKLEKLGLVEREPHVARGLSLTEEALALLGHASRVMRQVSTVLNLRIQGDIRAGEPVDFGNDSFATYDEDDVITFDTQMLPKNQGDLALFRVRGDSMIDAHVADGDLVILEPVTEAREGDMVAAWLKTEQELTLKHFHREGEWVRLQPANVTMDPIHSHASNVEVQGKVLLVMRAANGGARP
jgi:repressor LexA